MIRSLRKGRANVYFQHALTGHRICAEQFECEVAHGKAILRFRVRPIDGNQRSDETYLHELPLLSITLDDAKVIGDLGEFMLRRIDEYSTWELQISSRGSLLQFVVVPQARVQGNHHTLCFAVEPSANTQH